MKVDKKKIAIVWIAITIILIVVCIIFLIWKPNEKTNLFYYGKDIKMDELLNTIGESYSSDVRDKLVVSNKAELFKILDPNYLKENNLNEENFADFLSSNYLIGDEPIMLSYKHQKQGDVYIYTYEYRINGFIRYVSLIETYPFKYTLSFKQDGAPTINSLVTDQEVEGINFYIVEKSRSNDSISYDLKFVNKMNKEVIFSFNSINDIVINMDDGGELKLSSTVVGSPEYKILKDGYLTKNIFFGVSYTNQTKILGMTFRNVTIDGVKKDVKVVF